MNDEGNMIRVLMIEPGKSPEMREISDTLKSMQEVVGGWIEEYMPFDDDVALVVNEEGKINGLPLNRAIRSEDGSLQDIMAGPFFICSAPVESESYQSLTPEMEKKYREKFRNPERFYMTDKGIHVVQEGSPREKEAEREKTLWQSFRLPQVTLCTCSSANGNIS